MPETDGCLRNRPSHTGDIVIYQEWACTFARFPSCVCVCVCARGHAHGQDQAATRQEICHPLALQQVLLGLLGVEAAAPSGPSLGLQECRDNHRSPRSSPLLPMHTACAPREGHRDSSSDGRASYLAFSAAQRGRAAGLYHHLLPGSSTGPRFPCSDIISSILQQEASSAAAAASAFPPIIKRTVIFLTAGRRGSSC